MISPKDVENAILSSFIFHGTMDFHKSESIFKLNVKFFNTRFRRRLAESINDEIDKGVVNFQLFATQIEDKVEDTKFHIDFIEVISQTPIELGLAKRYHDEFLGKKYREKVLFGMDG
ncbi:MAG TPA: hypothetical protein EYG93_06160 [Sulfurospirillum arcachonense]|nr:hypothetical protein [Sulfurospirillum arcachonense]